MADPLHYYLLLITCSIFFSIYGQSPRPPFVDISFLIFKKNPVRLAYKPKKHFQ